MLPSIFLLACFFYCFFLDSHHKLVHWRMVTNGAIDSYSRLVLYLKCTSNKATTVYEIFLIAVQNFRLPSNAAWQDMHSCVTLLYYRLFYYLEQIDLLDPLSNLHLWALHYVYLRRINRSLDEFVLSWNNHPIRSACHKTPQQLYTAGCLLLQTSNIIFPRLLR